MKLAIHSPVFRCKALLLVGTTLAPAVVGAPAEPTPQTTAANSQAHAGSAQDHAAAIRAAGTDLDKLIQLAQAWTSTGESGAARAAYERIIEIDESNAAAHEGLGHLTYEGLWFETYAALSKHRRAEAKRRLQEEGTAPYGGEWVPREDIPFIRMGWVQEAGQWIHPADAQARAHEAKLEAAGWGRQDLTWIHPEDFDKWSKKESQWTAWKVGEEWMSLENANAYHSHLDQWWRIPGEHFEAWTTLDHDSALWAAWWADQTYEDLVRIFGVEPTSKPAFLTLNGKDQYNVFAAGDPTTGRGDSELTGWSSVHYAFFAESYFDASSDPPRYRGMGVSYWAVTDDTLKNYGQHAIRHAAAQSYIDAIDPSWDIISRVIEGSAEPQGTRFWGEKTIPLWLRFGAASYVERFFKDGKVDPASDNPWWARDWAMGNLRNAGGLRPFDEIFAFALDPADPADSSKMIAEAGLIVSFILDGGCTPVSAAHQAFKAALEAGAGVPEAAQELQEQVVANRWQFLLGGRAFARCLAVGVSLGLEVIWLRG